MLAQYFFTASIVLAAAHVNHAASPESAKHNLLLRLQNNPKELLVANINKHVEYIIPEIQSALQKLVPVALPNVENSIYVMYFILTDGQLWELQSVRRADDSKVSYDNKVLTVDMSIGWEHVKFQYKCDWRWFLASCSGIYTGDLLDMRVNIGVSVDFNNYQVVFNQFNMYKLETISGSVDGGIMCSISSPIINMLTKLLKPVVINSVESEAKAIIMNYVDKLNEHLENHTSRRFTFVDRAPEIDISKISLELDYSDIYV